MVIKGTGKGGVKGGGGRGPDTQGVGEKRKKQGRYVIVARASMRGEKGRVRYLGHEKTRKTRNVEGAGTRGGEGTNIKQNSGGCK